VVNAAKDRMGPEEALALVRESSKLIAAKGKKVVTLNLKADAPDDDQIKSLIIGPSGWLRAPTWRRGKTVVVGFNEEAYDALLGA